MFRSMRKIMYTVSDVPGRAGREGCSVTMVTLDDLKVFREIEANLGGSLTWIGDPLPDDAEERVKTGPSRPWPRQSARSGRASVQIKQSRFRQRRSAAPGRWRHKRRNRRLLQSDGNRKDPERGKITGAANRTMTNRFIGLGDHVPAFLLRPIPGR